MANPKDFATYEKYIAAQQREYLLSDLSQYLQSGEHIEPGELFTYRVSLQGCGFSTWVSYMQAITQEMLDQVNGDEKQERNANEK